MLTACLLFIATLGAWAGDCDYLVIVNENGSMQSFTADGLRMDFADGSLTVTPANDDAAVTLALADLSMMYFSEQPANGTSTAIDLPVLADNEAVTLYTATGALAGHFANTAEALAAVQPGVYLAKGKNIVVKIVKK